MKIVDIFVIEKGAIYAVQFDGVDCDEFALTFRNWNDTEYLEQFFEDNNLDLLLGDYKNISIEEAIFITLKESTEFEAKIKRIAKTGNFERKTSLQDLVFNPLKKNDTDFNLQESKAYGTNHKSWLRIYAIRISPIQYVISGSAIKLRDKMKDSEVTQRELIKLEATARYLKENGYLEEDDFGYIDFSN